jgi:glycosyltransferase involved in cell wall biosynthesis
MNISDIQQEPPAISVVIPVYNREDVILRALSSLVTQDFKHPYEVIVVDDGSTDQTAEMVAEYGRGIRLIRQENRGAHHARRAGAKAATGEYIAFLDSDDEALSTHLSAHYRTLQSHPQAILSFAASQDRFGKQPLHLSHPALLLAGTILDQPLLDFLEIGGFIFGMNVSLKREMFLELTDDMPDYWPAEDIAFCLRASKQGPFVSVGEVTQIRELRDDSVSRTMLSLQDTQCFLSMIEAWEMSPAFHTQEYQSYFRQAIRRYGPSATVYFLLQSRWQELRRMLRLTKCGFSYSYFRNLFRQLFSQSCGRLSSPHKPQRQPQRLAPTKL